MILDEGYQYGLGAFETIAVVENKAIFLMEHLHRLNKTLAFLNISQSISEETVQNHLVQHPIPYGALKIMISEKNLTFKESQVVYPKAQYQNGFRIDYSKVKRNETSPLTYHKTLNYGDCILEKRNAKRLGLDELLFLNTRDELTEGSVCNIFFAKDGQLYTPPISCGLLPGILRDYIGQTYTVTEQIIKREDIPGFDECFVTNSLMGIMPVQSLGNVEFNIRTLTETIIKKYLAEILRIKDWPL